MQVSASKEFKQPDFIPVKVEIVFETRDELYAVLNFLGNYSDITYKQIYGNMVAGGSTRLSRNDIQDINYNFYDGLRKAVSPFAQGENI